MFKFSVLSSHFCDSEECAAQLASHVMINFFHCTDRR